MENLSSQVIVASIFGVVFIITMLSIAIVFPKPSAYQYQTFRIILSLAAAGVAAMIPGFVSVQLDLGTRFLLGAGGALAVFVIVYFFNPAKLAVHETQLDLISIVDRISEKINGFVFENEETLSPFLVDSQKRQSVAADMMHLFYKQKSRRDFGEWKSALEEVKTTVRDSKIRDSITNLIIAIERVHSALYDEDSLGKYEVAISLRDHASINDKEAVEIVRDYLNRLQTLDESVGHAVGALKTKLQQDL